MAQIIKMPKLGVNMTEGLLVTWHRREGETIEKGEPFFDLETDKSTMTIEATCDATVLKILVEECESVPIFTPVAVVGEVGEDPDEALKQDELKLEAQPKAENAEESTQRSGDSAKEPTDSSDSAQKNREIRLSPRAKQYARQQGLSISELWEYADDNGVVTEERLMAISMTNKAESEKIQPGSVCGDNASQEGIKAEKTQPISSCTACESAEEISIPYQGIRKITGDRLSQSMQEAPHIYFTAVVDLTKLIQLRKELETDEQRFSLTAYLVCAASRALAAYPEINASLRGDRIIRHGHRNIGVAVAGNNGLIVPVIKETERKFLPEIASELRELVSKARVGGLLPDEYSGGTFTISNLSKTGIDSFTAIINPPESAILAVGGLHKEALVVTGSDGQETVSIRTVIRLTLSVDHRVIDGKLAADFLTGVKDLLEQPCRLLLP